MSRSTQLSAQNALDRSGAAYKLSMDGDGCWMRTYTLQPGNKPVKVPQVRADGTPDCRAPEGEL